MSNYITSISCIKLTYQSVVLAHGVTVMAPGIFLNKRNVTCSNEKSAYYYADKNPLETATSVLVILGVNDDRNSIYGSPNF